MSSYDVSSTLQALPDLYAGQFHLELDGFAANFILFIGNG